MRSILEKAFVALLNEEHDKAEEMFHQFIVERARQIHESNRAGDDYVLNENWDEEITNETYFTEDDLSDLEDDSEEMPEDGEVEGSEDEFDTIDTDDTDDMNDGDGFDGYGDDSEESEEEEVESSDERISDLQDQISELEAEFKAMMDALQDEGDMSDDSEDMEDMSDMDDMEGEIEGSEEDEAEDDAESIEDDMDDEEPAMEGEEPEEDYDDITESIIDELEKVSVSLEADGKEIGSGGGFTQNRGAAIPMKSKDARQGGQPIKMKHATHKGFERETAPSVETVKARRNNVKSADAALSKVSKEGNKSAEINKLSSETGNTKSPLEGK